MIDLAEKIKSIGFLNRLELDNRKIIIVVLIGAAVFYMDFNFIFKPQIKGLTKVSAEAAKLKKDVDNFKVDLKKMQDMEARQALSPPKADLKAKRVILENQFSSLLQDISNTANNNEVRITQLKPSREDQGSGSDNKAKAFGKLTPFFITLDLSCGYHNLGKFINELENLPSFLKVQDIRIEPREKDYLKQRVSLTLITYVKK